MRVKLLKKLGLPTQNLIPVLMKMHPAKNDITILGAIILTIGDKSQFGEDHKTKLTVYVTHDSDTFCLSCIDLRMISNTFVTVGVSLCTTKGTTTPNLSSPHNLDNASSPTTVILENRSKCTYLQEKLPPPKPSALPFPATEENRQKLEWFKVISCFQYIQHLQLDTKPLCLMNDPKATLVAHHTPVTVTVYWQEEVKAGLD